MLSDKSKQEFQTKQPIIYISKFKIIVVIATIILTASSVAPGELGNVSKWQFSKMECFGGTLGPIRAIIKK